MKMQNSKYTSCILEIILYPACFTKSNTVSCDLQEFEIYSTYNGFSQEFPMRLVGSMNLRSNFILNNK